MKRTSTLATLLAIFIVFATFSIAAAQQPPPPGTPPPRPEDGQQQGPPDDGNQQQQGQGNQVFPTMEPGTPVMGADPDELCNSFVDNATATCTEDTLIVESNGLPDHIMMVGILSGGWNGQFPTEQDFTGDNAFYIPLSPELASEVTIEVMNAAGVAVNGIPLFLPQSPGRSGGADCVIELENGECLRDPVAAGEMDVCGGHSGRANDYHYHTLTAEEGCLLDSLGDQEIVGVMLDGLPVLHGVIEGSTQIDECGGYVAPDGTHYYAVTIEYPYVSNCLVGVFDLNDQPHTEGIEAERGVPLPDAAISDFLHDEEGCHVLVFENGETRRLCE